MTRALTPEEIQEREDCEVRPRLTHRNSIGIWRDHGDRSTLVQPPGEWDGVDSFLELSLPAAAGNRFESLAEGLYRAEIRTVRDFYNAWDSDDARLNDGVTRLPGLRGSRPMYATHHQIVLFSGYLGRRCAEWEQSKESQ
jgi:hypothetical protein